MSSSIGVCIRCCANLRLIDSHIISEFMRNSFFGSVPNKAESVRMPHHRSQVVHATGLMRVIKKSGAQSLPTQPLMCANCDRSLGDSIESPVSKRIAAAGLAKYPDRIYDPAGVLSHCPQSPSVFCEQLAEAGPAYTYYEYESLPGDVALFVRLCCWRAMHAMARDGHPQVTAFLASATGQKANTEAKLLWDGQVDIHDSTDDIMVFIVPLPLVADTVGAPTGVLPFGWYWVADNVDPSLFGVVLWCAHWVAIWRPAAMAGIGPMTMMTFTQSALAESRSRLKARVAKIGQF